jgi:arsenate reductase (glutaredoxin)
MVQFFGIPNCDTVKKAKAFLDDKNIAYEFINFKTTAPTTAQLKKWIDAIGLEQLINKKSTTWKGLTAEQQAACSNAKGAITIMQENTSLIKRPVVVANGKIINGFNPTAWNDFF